ncbi:hypothetical protein ACU4GD_29280 [Cupriavidus basilensis]
MLVFVIGILLAERITPRPCPRARQPAPPAPAYRLHGWRAALCAAGVRAARAAGVLPSRDADAVPQMALAEGDGAVRAALYRAGAGNSFAAGQRDRAGSRAGCAADRLCGTWHCSRPQLAVARSRGCAAWAMPCPARWWRWACWCRWRGWTMPFRPGCNSIWDGRPGSC